MPNSSNNQPVLLGEFITFAAKRLKAGGIEEAERDARLLIAYGLQLDRAQLLTQTELVLTEKQIRLLTIYIECRAKHESVARIIGEREFWSLPFCLNEATLEPRPDSETLIETALKYFPKKDEPLRILDIGTGTGCLLLSLLHELSNATGLGVDIAPRAVEQAQENAEKLELAHRAQFKTNNWTDGIAETFDIIISNPPYIARETIPTLSSEVREFDPKLALDGGIDGLKAYQHLIPRLPALLNPKGLAVFEIGYDQAELVGDLFKATGFTIELHKDLGGNDRCVTAWID